MNRRLGCEPMALVGMMGAGKSTVGPFLARALGRPFVDLDTVIEHEAGQSVASLFATEGEEGFRDREERALARVLETPSPAGGLAGPVVACGGGVVEREGNRRRLRERAYTVWLEVDPAEGARRARAAGGRPLLAGEGAVGYEDLLARRRVWYAGGADLRVDSSGRPPEAVAREILRAAVGEEEVVVGLADRSYRVRVGAGLLEEAGRVARELGLSGRALVVAEPNTRAYGGRVARALEAAGYTVVEAELPPGEAAKAMEPVLALIDRALAGGVDRGGFFVTVGGGATGDAGGFAAAIYLRGVPFLQLPTTLLAQVDASVGGKVGVNHPRGKNLLGAFHQPRAVLADVGTLTTLPREEFVAGLAEVVKHALLEGPAALDALEEEVSSLSNRGPAAVVATVARSVRFKARIVADDERERGLRSILNLGHTTAHALERLAGYGGLRHGEAVAIGLVTAALLSARLGLLERQTVERVTELLARLGLPTRPPGLPPEVVWEALQTDKKARDGRPRFVLLEGPGRPVLREVPRELYCQVFREQAAGEAEP